jgi:2-dehydropantoate 2-reductase
MIAIVGAGALGGYYGGRLAQRGLDVHFLFRSDCQAVRQHGLRVKSCDGDFAIEPDRLHVYDDPRQMPQADLVIVTLKTTANDRLRDLVGPLLKADTVILTLQNGLGNEETLAALFGSQRVLGGMAFVCINRLGPGVIDHTAHGAIHLGEPTGGISDRASAVARLFTAAGIKARAIPDLRRGRWDKLAWNIPFNGLGALLDQSTDQLLITDQGTRLVMQLMDEVAAAAAAVGAPLGREVLQRHMDRTREMGAYRTSSQIDRQQGRPLEVEAIFGKPLEAARAAGAQTPYLEMLYFLLKQLPSPARSPGN